MIRPLKDFDDLSLVITEWMHETKENSFSLTIDPRKFMQDIERLHSSPSCGCLVMEQDGNVVGILGLKTFESPFGDNLIANEHYWYVVPRYRGYVRGFIKEAEKWAREKGCSHLMMNASYLASDLCHQVSGIYSLMGFSPLERVFIKEV